MTKIWSKMRSRAMGCFNGVSPLISTIQETFAFLVKLTSSENCLVGAFLCSGVAEKLHYLVEAEEQLRDISLLKGQICFSK